MTVARKIQIPLIYFIFSFISLNSLWLYKKFGELDFLQLLYHLQFGFDGLNSADKILVDSYIKYCILLPIFTSILIFLIYEIFTSHDKLLIRTIRILKHSLKNYITHTGITLTLLSTFGLLYTTGFFSFIYNILQDSNFIEENYSKPVALLPESEKTKNLVLIYVESLENTYSNPKVFGKDLLEELNQTTTDWLSFNKYHQYPGSGWTIAAITSTQCGIPLLPESFISKTSIKKLNGNEIGQQTENFLPNATCLGDILKANGYTNIFLGGADLNFAGKGNFLRQHGYEKVFGRNEWEILDKDVSEGWGLYDDDLFEEAKKNFKDLYDAQKPFNLTILTVDTHHPSGHLSPTCKSKGFEEFTGIIECTSFLVSDFIKYIQANDTNQNTNIIVMGDHLAMKNSVYEKLEQTDRTIYNKFFSHNKKTKSRDEISHFSMLPTILEFLDFDIPSQKAGIGISALSSKELIDIENRKIALNEELRKPSKYYRNFWSN